MKQVRTQKQSKLLLSVILAVTLAVGLMPCYSLHAEVAFASEAQGIGITGANVDICYDGSAHEAPAAARGTTATPKYSTSTDEQSWSSWSATVPSLTDAGTLYIKAKVEDAGQEAETSYTLTINPRKVSVMSGSAAYAWSDAPATVTNPACVVTSGSFVEGEMAEGYPQATGSVAKPASQPEVGVPATAANTIECSWVGNGKLANYDITENLGTLAIVNDDQAYAVATDYTGTYDGLAHGGSVVSTLKDATVQYSTDDKEIDDPSKEWLDSEPTFKDVTKTKVDVKLAKGPTATYCSYEVIITQRNLVLTVGSASKAYDGTALTCSEVIAGGDGYAGGEEAILTVMPCATGTYTPITLKDVGTAENVLMAVEDNSQTGFVGSNYKIITSKGTLEVTKRNVTVTSASASKPYDGTPLTNNEVTVSGEGFIEGEGATYDFTASQTDAGSSANAFDYTLNEGTSAGNYDITTEYGTLEVAKRSVALTSASATKVYDGTPLAAEGIAVAGEGFIEGEGATYDFTGSQTDAGSSASAFDYTLNEGTAAGNYDITTEYGTLEVTKRSVALTSASATKVYDGTPLTNDEVTVSGEGFIEGEGAAFNVTGTQTNVGTSDNTFTYELNAGTLASNYTITKVEGKLVVTAAETLTVTYTDGIGGKAFADQVTTGLNAGDPTPAFNGTPAREGYAFTGWKPEVSKTVTESVVYTAQWKANTPEPGPTPGPEPKPEPAPAPTPDPEPVIPSTGDATPFAPLALIAIAAGACLFIARKRRA